MNTHNILVLGVSGTGKTLFLASMYEKLSVQKNEVGFFVQTPERERIILANTYREMESPSAEWPPATLETREWKFICSVHAGQTNFPLLEFAYLDYGGGRLTLAIPDGTESTFSIDKAAEKADAILVLLDGLKILRHLEGTWETLSSPLHNDLRYILPILQNLDSKPLHFVVTKWDLLQDKYTLRQVRDFLVQDERFAAIVEQQRTRESPTRLIPVSAVGKGFATLNADNSMSKNQNVIPHPFQVEVPIACVLIDGFQVAQRNLTERQRNTLLKKKGFWRRFFQTITGDVKDAPEMPLPQPFQYAQSLLRYLLGLVNKQLTTSIEELEREREDSLKSIKNEDSAMQNLILSYHILMSKLERDFPESNLHKI